MADWQNPIGSTPDYSMSLQGLSGSLGNNLATWLRAKQRGFNAAATGDLGDSLSEAMATPNDDLFTEALADQKATVGDKYGLPGQETGAPGSISGGAPGTVSGVPGRVSGPLPGTVNGSLPTKFNPASLNSLSSSQLAAGPDSSWTPEQQAAYNSLQNRPSLKGLRPRQTQGTTFSTPIEQ